MNVPLDVLQEKKKFWSLNKLTCKQSELKLTGSTATVHRDSQFLLAECLGVHPVEEGVGHVVPPPLKPYSIYTRTHKGSVNTLFLGMLQCFN